MFNLFKNKIDVVVELEKHVQNITNGAILSLKNENYASHTLYGYKAALGHFKNFLNGKTLHADDFSKRTIDDFIKWLVDNNFSKNSVWNNVKNIRTMSSRLRRDGVFPLRLNLGEISLSKEVTTAIYNTEKEIAMLTDLDLSLTERLKKVRDLYVVQCCIGLRYSDLKRFQASPKAFIRQNEDVHLLQITAQKTKQNLSIPLKSLAVKIIEENNYKFGKPFSLQHYNGTLKKLGKYAGIDDEIIFTRTNGGKRKEIIKEKWELMSSHTARRSFATNAFLAGVSSLQIRQITGHTTEESFLKYIRASGLENAMTLINHPFFK